MVTKKKRETVVNTPEKLLAQNTYTDFTGVYNIDSLIQWANEYKGQTQLLKTEDFLNYVCIDTWGEYSDESQSNLSHLMQDPQKLKRVLEADLSYPIFLTPDNRVIDGVHRLFKAIYEGHSTIKGIFIEPDILHKFKISSEEEIPQTGTHLPIPDLYVRVPKNRLSEEEGKRREQLESYFSDHLPSAIEESEGWLICLERPQECYGCYLHDIDLKAGLQWWGETIQVHDIPFQKKLYDKGLLAIEDQWMPYSWSRYFEKNNGLPSEIVLLHLDDHQDMMPPRIGRRLDGKLFDFITGKSIELDNLSSVEGAILSGAIGKGSILMPLIWSVPKIHVRHLCFRPHPCTTYHIQKVTIPDGLLSKSDNRISLRLEPTNENALLAHSNYTVTPEIDEWLSHIPNDIPIFLHIDMDYFNDRFDGNSDWEIENKRRHDISLANQIHLIEKIFKALADKSLHSRIVDTSIGISPGFYPAEFWSSTVPKVLDEARNKGIL